MRADVLGNVQKLLINSNTKKCSNFTYYSIAMG